MGNRRTRVATPHVVAYPRDWHIPTLRKFYRVDEFLHCLSFRVSGSSDINQRRPSLLASTFFNQIRRYTACSDIPCLRAYSLGLIFWFISRRSVRPAGSF